VSIRLYGDIVTVRKVMQIQISFLRCLCERLHRADLHMVCLGPLIISGLRKDSTRCEANDNKSNAVA
jgi:hypothetical protein